MNRCRVGQLRFETTSTTRERPPSELDKTKQTHRATVEPLKRTRSAPVLPSGQQAWIKLCLNQQNLINRSSHVLEESFLESLRCRLGRCRRLRSRRRGRGPTTQMQNKLARQIRIKWGALLRGRNSGKPNILSRLHQQEARAISCLKKRGSEPLELVLADVDRNLSACKETRGPDAAAAVASASFPYSVVCCHHWAASILLD